ncbi:MAG: RNA polymerase sigma factor [Pirellulales bacterium]
MQNVGHSSSREIEVASVVEFFQSWTVGRNWMQLYPHGLRGFRVIEIVEELFLAMHVPLESSEVEPEWVRNHIRAVQNGNSGSYSQVVNHYQQTIAQQMIRFSMESRIREELTHDVFVEAYLSLRSYRFDSPFLHWLRRIAVRVGYRHWKKLKRSQIQQSISEEQWHSITSNGVNQEILADEAAELVYCMLAQLPPADRLVLTVIYLDGCTLKDAAFRCGWTLTGTKLRVFRARRRLAQLLNEKDHE